MNAIRYNSCAVRTAMPADLSQVIQRFFTDAQDPKTGTAENLYSPRVDILDEPARYLLAVDLPGVDAKTVDLKLDGQVLSISGERSAMAAVEGARASRIERTFGQFYRRFVLPENADLNAITASGAHGVLEISVPKKAPLIPRKIEVA